MAIAFTFSLVQITYQYVLIICTYRCLREMGTPLYGDPGPHIPSDMGTGEPHITRDVGPWGPQNSGGMGTLQ